MKDFNFENTLQNKDKDAELKKLLSEANEGKVPDEYSMESGVEFDEVKSGLTENIISGAQEMLRNDLSQMLNEEERLRMEEVIDRISNVKRRSAADLWLSEANRLIQNGENADNFKKLATGNLYKEMKKEVEGQLGIVESSN